MAAMANPTQLVRLIEALSDPAAYAPQATPSPFVKGGKDPLRTPGEPVAIHQTHISVVFLAGPFAFKIKKPLRLSFLDFSTLDQRRHFCEEEVRLNRRLAPHVYLGVVPVTLDGSTIRLEGKGEPIEWAVKMWRLPEGATFHDRLLGGQIGSSQAEMLARRIASFHESAERNSRIAAFGRFQAVAENLRAVFEQSAAQVGTTVSPAVFERLRALTEQSLAALQTLIEERERRGLPRDTHGDLHLDHVYFFPDRPEPEQLVIVDCIEFNERFRYTDPIADTAFPAMDFAYHGRRDLARAFAETYFRATGDEQGRQLLPLYTAYRAAVRGSVEGLKLAEPEITAADRERTLQQARGHWLLALGQLEEPARRPGLALVGGLPGTGKSTLAELLAGRAGFSVVRSDVVRKQLAGREPTARLEDRFYSAEWNERTYAECLRRAENGLWQGQRVVVDATFREDKRRQAFFEAALRWGVPALLLVCGASPATVRQRLSARRDDVSDAEWATYLKLGPEWEKPAPNSNTTVREIDTGGNQDVALQQALEALREAGLAN
jgi:aminoglycoside phosphotransferase family enzyme/predicted kinase